MPRTIKFKRTQAKFLSLIVLTATALVSMSSLLFIANLKSNNFVQEAFATETQCREESEAQLDQCEIDLIDENIFTCADQCELEITDEALANYTSYTGSSVYDICLSSCEYGYDDAYSCQGYLADYYEGYDESYAFAGCFEVCVDDNGVEYEDDCYNYCDQGDTINCTIAADDDGFVSSLAFCGELEANSPEDFGFCELLEDYGIYADAIESCEADGFYWEFDAFFCAESSNVVCESECLLDGGDANMCDDLTGACQYVPTATDSDVPTFSFSNITWNSFEETNSIRGHVTDASQIVSVDVTVDEISGPWEECDCEDWPCDSDDEYFLCEGIEMEDGETELYFRAEDEHGNVHTIANYHNETAFVNPSPTNDIVFSLDMNSTTLTDLSLFAVNGSHTGGTPSVTTGYAGNSLDYTGTLHSQIQDQLALYDFSEVNTFTAEAYIYSEDFADGVYGRVITKTKDNNSDILWALTIDPSGKLYCEINTAAGFTTVTTDDPLTNEEWNHVAFTWDGRYLKAIVNEIEVKATDIGVQDSFFNTSYGLLTIAGETNNWDQRAFNGLVDDVKLYNVAKEYSQVDTRPPATIIDKSYDNLSAISDNTPTFTGTITDEIEIVSARYLFTDLLGISYDSPTTFDDLNWHAFLPDDGVWDEDEETFTITSESSLDEGEQYLYVIAVDIFGNESYHNLVGYFHTFAFDSDSIVASKRFVINALDESAPNIYGQLVIPDPTVDRSPYLQGYVIDDKSDLTSNITNISYKIDSGDWITISPLDGTYNATKEDFSLQLETLDIGTHTLSISSTDAAGNSTIIQNSNYTDEFEIVPFTKRESYIASKSEDFNSHEFHDLLYTDGVWGNGIARLRQELSITPELKYNPGVEAYGNLYGAIGSAYTMTESVDEIGIWFTANSNTLYYYNTTNDNITDYGIILGDNVQEIFEFTHSGNRYLIVSYSNDSYIIDINNTPESIVDDTTINWGSFYTTNELGAWGDMVLDERTSDLGIYLIAGTTDSNNLIYVDLNNTPTILTDDTFTTWGAADGLTGQTNYTAFYFDQNNDNVYAFPYSYGLHSCNDNGTPTIKGDDTCYNEAQTTERVPSRVFSAEYDIESDLLWLGGDKGLHFVDINATASPADDEWTRLISPNDIAFESIEHITVVPSDYPVGQEIIFATRELSIRGIEINFTPTDTYDDTLYEYFIEQGDGSNINGGGVGFAMTNINSLWLNLPRQGLYQYNLSRSFAAQNIIESLPNPPSDVLEVNNITLEDISGTLGTPTLSTLSTTTLTGYSYPGVDFYISNDGGQTWKIIKENETVNLDTDNYLIKFRAVLNNLAGETPILDSMSLSYAAYNLPEEENRELTIQNTSEADINENVSVTVSLVDELGFNDDVTQQVSLDLRLASDHSVSSNCLALNDSVNLVNGEATFNVKATCAGAFQIYGYNTSDPSENAYGNVITITSATSTTIVTTEEITEEVEACGNGVIDENEECDGEISDLVCSDFAEYEQGELSCNSDCTINKNFCIPITSEVTSVEETPTTTESTITTPDEINVEYETGYLSTFLIPLLIIELLALANTLASGSVLLYLPTLLLQLPALLLRYGLLLLRFFGLKEDGREVGYVYDSITKEPLSLAVVRIFNEDKKLVQTEVTNSFGAFVTNVEDNKYFITASKSSYIFPSKIVTTESDKPILNVYQGNLHGFSADEIENVSIPMDPTNADVVLRSSEVRNQLSAFFSVLVNVLNILGLTISIYAIQLDKSLINYLILAGYVFVISLTLYRRFWGYRDQKVISKYTGNVTEEAVVLLYKAGSEAALDKRITKHDGTYRFVVPNGSYDLVAKKDEQVGAIREVENSSDRIKRISEEIEI
jgi:hypothetical protein